MQKKNRFFYLLEKTLPLVFIFFFWLSIIPLFGQVSSVATKTGKSNTYKQGTSQTQHARSKSASQKKKKKPKGPTTIPPSVVVSSYFNAPLPANEWTELLVVNDNTNMQGWTLQDNNAGQNSFQTPPYIFKTVPLWQNMRAGTVIMVWSHGAHPTQVNKVDGYIEVCADDATYFTAGGATCLNIAVGGDLVKLQEPPGPTYTFVQAIGHNNLGVAGPSFYNLPTPAAPKLNYNGGNVTDNSAVIVSPGHDLDHYGNIPASAPQDGTQWMAIETNANLTFGLPNKQNPNNLAFPASANSDFWRSLRQPAWTAPTLNFTVDANNTQVTLTWNAATDPNPADGTQGYMIVRNTSNTFGTPVDGHTYIVGDIIPGQGEVIGIIPSSQTLTYVDNTPIPCVGGFFYRVYAFRYTKDFVKPNDFDLARGRAYNETNFAAKQALFPDPVANTSATSTPDNFCVGTPPATITLAAPGGSGTVMNWYSGGCGTAGGGTLVGAGTGANNSITIPPPATTTTYYARWETPCSNSACVNVTVTVNPNSPVSVTITANPVSPICAGTSVTFTATPTNGGTAPAYQWKVNGTPVVGAISNTYNYAPSDNDNITVDLTSNASCASGNPATSNTIIMTVNPVLPVSVVITASQDPVCPGTPVTYTATPTNGGTTPQYQWKVNTLVVGTTNTYTYSPAPGDIITCTVTSNGTCVSNNPATSPPFMPTFSTSVLLSVSITPSQDPVCTGNPATYTAIPVNGGSNPTFEWHINGGPPVGTGSTYTYSPVAGDVITCIVNSNAGCVSNNPQTGTFTPTFTSAVLLSVSITPGQDPVCAGTSVTYTAVPVNGGAAPTYEWHVNGGPVVGTNSTYSYIPANGDALTCIVNSNASCISNNPQTASFSPTVSSSLVVSVSISASEDPVCAGTSVTYTAHPQNEGTAPIYDWTRTGGFVATGPTYTCVPNAGDVITCILTSNAGCVSTPTATASINPTVTNSMVMGISLAATQNPACQGASVKYTAHVVNGGSAPVYVWKVNGIVVTGIDSTYTYIPAPGDQIRCVVTANSTCTTNNPDSTTFSPVIQAPLTVNLTVTGNPTSICAGTEVTFTADTLNAGSSPLFDWMINGTIAQSGPSGIFKTSTLAGGQSVTCQLTSSLTCLVANPVVSPPITITISPSPTVKLSDQDYLCSGTASQLDAGPFFAAYLWQDGSTDRYYTASDIGQYWVTVTDTIGCIGKSDTVVLKVCETGVYVPTAFSPNSDGNNDLFKAIATLDANTSFSMSVINRWGESVFETNNINIGWDGTMSGQPLPPGTYGWMIVYQSVNSTEKPTTLKGTVTLIR